MKSFKTKYLILILLFIFSGTTKVLATNCPPPSLIKENLRKVFPQLKNFKVEKISPAPVPGICQVILDFGSPFRKIIYTDSQARYLFLGQIVDIETHKNITRLEALRYARLSTEQMKKLEHIVAFSEGHGKKWVYLILDPDCPFCKRLEKIITKFVERGQLTVKVILLPLKKLHPEAENKAIAIICDKKGFAGLTSGYISHNLCKEGQTKVEESIRYLEHLGIRATPTIVFPDGQLLQGLPPESILAEKLGLISSVKK